MSKYIDPPEGWKYGFPKKLPKKSPKDIMQWLIKKGYPEYKIKDYGEYFYCRSWEEE